LRLRRLPFPSVIRGVMQLTFSPKFWRRNGKPFQAKVREERGLTYSIGSAAVMYRDCGFLSISLGIA
jgi:predicted Zn-dependent peptidase